MVNKLFFSSFKRLIYIVTNIINHLGEKNRKITKITRAIRFNKISLNKYSVSTNCKILKEKLQIKNTASVHQFVNMFNLFSLKNSIISYIERCFIIVSDNKRFLELDYNFISKILASSELLITSKI